MDNFSISCVDTQAIAAISNTLNLPRFVAEVLVRRNIKTPKEAQKFMNTSLDLVWQNPYEIPGMKEVVHDLNEAIRQNRHILVFGDFDLDGISATCVLTRGLRDLGANVTPFIPDRFSEGYGLSIKAFERALKRDPDIEVLVSVDCGIACRDSVKEIKARGIDVLITDHHEPGDSVPQGVPIADPKLDKDCKSSILAGVGVACKVLSALFSKYGKPYMWKQYCDFATLGTVADLMPMRDENRALVAAGLHQMNTKPRACIAALLEVSGAGSQALTSTNMSFSITPRLNAAGRMGKAELALDLLMCDDYDQSFKLAEMLEKTNNKRRKIESELSDMALEVAAETYTDQRALVVWGEGWHEGVKGIVANRLVSKYGVPSILFSITDGEARGSGRTVGSINLFDALQSCSDLLTRFGGHAAAVGVTLPKENLPEFNRRLCEYMDQFPESAFHPVKKIDAVVSLSELSVESIQKLNQLAPFGQENKTPLLLAPNVYLDGGHAVGADKNHFSCSLLDSKNKVSAILFNCADTIDDLLDKKDPVHAMFNAEINVWRGVKSAKAMLREICDADSLENHIDFSDASKDKSEGYVGNDLCGTHDAHDTQAAHDTRGTHGAHDTHGTHGTHGAHDAALDGNNFADESLRVRDANIDLGQYRCLPLENSRLHKLEQNRLRWSNIAKTLSQQKSDGVQKDMGEENQPSKNNAKSRDSGGDLEKLDSGECTIDPLSDEIVRAIIGDAKLHKSQIEALNYLNQDLSVLAVMATGRGKSLIFQVHATRLALQENKVSLFVYPLRALIADQEYHLSRLLAAFGVCAKRLTGETSKQEREHIYEQLSSGKIDIVLTTPEFLCIHAKRLASACKFSFVVIDEAHHVAGAKSGNRTAYAQINKALAYFDNPLVLALTATASNDVAKDILDVLPIEKCVIDNSSRDNLIIDDQRNIRSREKYLAELVASGEKTVIYVNSREQSVSLARILRGSVPNQAPYIGFYNAALHPLERKRIEQLFRNDVISVLISTSAFGEGVNIPNVRHVVLYHLPFSDIEFNQMAGRAGRDGAESVIHLLFGRADASINEHILQVLTPRHETMACVYRCLRDMQQKCGGEAFEITIDEVVNSATTKAQPVLAPSVECGVSVFSELGLIDADEHFKAGKSIYSISVTQDADRVSLSDSIRYREGERDLCVFDSFKSWVLNATGPDLRERIAHPIVPDAPFLECEQSGENTQTHASNTAALQSVGGE